MIIKLQRGYETIIDDEDFDKIKDFRWFYGAGGTYVGANILPRPKQILLHRLIMNTPKGFHTDHINGNKLDNRKSNLRICTSAQNIANSRKHTNKTSKFKGVSWFTRDKCWRAYVSYKRRQFHLGYFESEKEAALAYNKGAVKYFGEYAFLNSF